MKTRAVIGVLAALGIGARAASPTLEHLYPVAVQQGATAMVDVSGKFDPWPPQVWVDGPGIAFHVTPVTGKFAVEIGPDAAPGPHLVRFFNGEGASAPRFVIVSAAAQSKDIEPNDALGAAQSLPSLPVELNGRLDKSGDVDCFAVSIKRGQTLVARLEGYVLGSLFDGMLRIVDAAGQQLAFNHDGRTQDPLLAWEAPRDGTFFLQVMGFSYPASSDVRFAGGEGCVYRLHLTGGPFVHHTLPLAIFRDAPAQVALLAGWNLEAQSAQIDPKEPAGAALLGAFFLSAPFLSDHAEILESGAGSPQAVDLPVGVSGTIGAPNQEDRFEFQAAKGRAYEFEARAMRAGSALDPWLKIEDAQGRELARNDDADGGRDARLAWTAPADGRFRVALGDLTHRGGADFFYRLALGEAVPSVEATVAEHSLVLAEGKPAGFKVKVKRLHGFAKKLMLAAKGLPEGIGAPEVEVPAKDGEVTLTLTAQPGTKAASQPIGLVLREAESGAEYPVRFWLTSRNEDNGVPQGYSELVLESTGQLWLSTPAVPEAQPPVPAPDAPKP